MWNMWGVWCHAHGWNDPGKGVVPLISSVELLYIQFLFRSNLNDRMDVLSDLWISASPARPSPTPCGSTRAARWHRPEQSWPLTSRSSSPWSRWSARDRCLSPGRKLASFSRLMPSREFVLIQPDCVGFRSGCCHGVALWMEYHLTDDITVSTGLVGPISEQVPPPPPHTHTHTLDLV